MAEVLVTGATGNVGAAVCEAPLARGGRARRGDRPGVLRNRGSVRLDFRDPRTFGPAVRGCESLFLLRPPAIGRVGPTLNRLIDVAVEAGVRHVTFLSVAGAGSNPIVPHHRVERRLMRGGPFTWTILRPGFFAQNITGAYAGDIRAGRIVVPAGDGRVAFVDAGDLGEVAAYTLLDPAAHAGAAYHLTGRAPGRSARSRRCSPRCSGTRFAPSPPAH